MSAETPDVVCTTNTETGSLVQVKVCQKRKVTYRFNTPSKNGLSLPYAVAVNGKVSSIYADKPRRTGGKDVTVTVDAGATVALFLNSDSHPAYRNHAVYAVCPKENDILVTITEKTGKHSDSDKPVRAKGQAETAAGAGAADHYSAPLTGDIWLRVTHRYSSDEANALIPAATHPAIRSAVLSIYSGLTSPQLGARLPATADNPACDLQVVFSDASNAAANITSYSSVRDGLPRIHPLAYVALLEAAHAAGVSRVTVNSGWRPMLGEIPHRAGLGLDINYFEADGKKVQVNREELSRSNGKHAGNVSENEKKLYLDYQLAKEKDRDAEITKEAARASLKSDEDPDRRSDLLSVLDSALKKERETKTAVSKAKDSWNAERDKNEPIAMRSLRSRLSRRPHVVQLFDPWYMDTNTHDNATATANEQRKGNGLEILHNNHLHISVYEPKIL